MDTNKGKSVDVHDAHSDERDESEQVASLPGGRGDEERKRQTLHDDLMTEYYKLVDIVTSFDGRLLTIKGWGVTLSLASLGLGFQQGHYGLFLVAALSGLAFGVVEGTTKNHQRRYYPRMGDIDEAAFELYGVEKDGRPVSSPMIDWGWYVAMQRFIVGVKYKGDPSRPERWDDDASKKVCRHGRLVAERDSDGKVVFKGRTARVQLSIERIESLLCFIPT